MFPSRKLKGNCTFTAQIAIVESVGTEGDSTAGPEGEEEAVNLYQKKNQNCFRCGTPDHLVNNCPKDLSKVTRKASFNVKGGTTKQASRTPQKPVVA